MAGVDILAIIVLNVLVIGGLAFVINRSGKDSSEEPEGGTTTTTSSNDKFAAAAEKHRRKNIQKAIEAFERRQQSSTMDPENPSFPVLLEQSGLLWPRRQYFIVSASVSFIAILLLLVVGVPMFIALLAGAVGGLGVTYLFVRFMRTRRQKLFVDQLPEALDVIVRGVRSGFPVTDCIATVAEEHEDPVRSEFKRVIDFQKVGVPLGAACMKLYEYMPVPEVNFIGIAVSVQQSTGGNLGEILANLAGVLRDRKRMRNKIQSVSQEAKTSAFIIASLPVGVSAAITYLAPEYMEPLWNTTYGNIILVVAVVLMLCGVSVMSRMINFEI